MKSVGLNEARELLMTGEVVAIPTETVYGLAGWIKSEAGLGKIFAVKERPFFDPLIVHVGSIKQARELTSEWTEVHQVLAEACWPGPLTLIAKKNEAVHPLITAGLDSVGIRCPDHALTLDLLSQMEGGLAAPSANKFGKTSPARAAHVYQEFGDSVAILDGGDCRVGIESTVAGIIKWGDEWRVEIYRPGHFTASYLQSLLLPRFPRIRVIYSQSPVAPGQLQHHYMPRIPLVIVPEDFVWEKERQQIDLALGKTFSAPAIWQQSLEPQAASRELYHKLREFDEQGYDLIIVAQLPHQHSEDWQGIWNRLHKAKTLQIASKR